MKRWIWAFILGFCVYLILGLVLISVVSGNVAAVISVVAGIAVMIRAARSGRPSTDA